jgi:glutamine synthetase
MSKYSEKQIREIIEKENIKYIRLMFTDMDGILKNVEIPVSRLDDALENKIMFDGSSIEGFARVFEADMYLHPDLDTFLILDWEDSSYGKAARFICDIYKPGEHTGEHVPFEGDPRGILKKNVEAMKKLGFKALNCGVEPEFFLFKIGPDGKPSLDFNDKGDYFDLAPMDSAVDCRRDIVLALQKIGFDVEASHHEAAPGQHEIDFKYDTALAACDNVQTFKLVVKNIARRHGLHATFMPKPVAGINGSGMHVNCSLLTQDNKNAFFDDNTPNKLSQLALDWIDGIIAHAKGFCFLTNPTVNSYKRIVPGYEAPCYISWSDSNRSTMIRIPAARGMATRTEVRSVDVSANPYLAISAILAAGMDGVKKNCPHTEAIYDNLYVMNQKERDEKGIESLPGNLYDAMQGFLKDDVIKNAVGPIVTEKLVDSKKNEWDSFRCAVTDWEIKNYFEKY